MSRAVNPRDNRRQANAQANANAQAAETDGTITAGAITAPCTWLEAAKQAPRRQRFSLTRSRTMSPKQAHLA